MIKGLNKGKPVLVVNCLCGNEYESKYNRGEMKQYLKEIGEYENHMTEPCEKCDRVTVVNLNLPKSELEESFFGEVDMPEEERIERRVIKDLMDNEFKFEEVE